MEKQARPYKFDQGIAVLPNTPAYDLRLTYRFQHGFHHSVVQTHAQGKSLEKHDTGMRKSTNYLKKKKTANMTNHKITQRILTLTCDISTIQKQ